jgi:hypothetical protein
MQGKNTRVYSEVVAITVLSLVAANAWIRWLSASLNKLYPGSLKVDFLVAVGTTIVAIVLLNLFFG